MRWLSVALLAVAVTTLTPAYAEETQREPKAGADEVSRPWLKQESGTDRGSTRSGGHPWGAIVGGVLVASLVAGALYRRRQLRRFAVEKGASRIQILETTRIGPKAQLVTAVVGGRVVVLGVTESQITALSWMDPAELGETDAEIPVTSAEALGSARRESVPKRDSSAENGKPMASRRFGGILRQALSLGTDAEAADDSAAVRLANRTRDVVSCSAEAAARASGANTSRSIDIEGQAAGLVARLSKGQR